MSQINSTLAGSSTYQETLEQIRHQVKVTLEEVMGDSSPEILDEMSTIFLEDANPLIDQIKEGYSKQDNAIVSMAAHALKGSSATIGLVKFADICLSIETNSKQKEQYLIASNLTKLEAEYVIVQEALGAFLI